MSCCSSSRSGCLEAPRNVLHGLVEAAVVYLCSSGVSGSMGVIELVLLGYAEAGAGAAGRKCGA